MPTASTLLTNSSIQLSLLAGAADRATVTSVVAVESLDRVAHARASSVVVVIESAARHAAGYELDVAIRHATDRRLGALILVGRSTLALTSQSLANRAELAVMSAPAGIDVADLVLRIDRIIRGGAADTLVRVEAALDAISRCGDAPAAEIVEAAGRALSIPLAYTAASERTADGTGVVTVRGTPVGVVEAAPSATLDEACIVVLPALIAAAERSVAADYARRYAPVESRAELVSQLLVAERDQLAPLMTQARHLAFPAERTHIVTALRAHGSDQGGDIRSWRELLDSTEVIALQSLPRSGDEWNIARPPGSLIIIRSLGHDRPKSRADTQRDIRRLLETMPADSRARLAAGMGAAHPGIEGLRQSAHEADNAVTSAVHARRFGEVTIFDATGIERVIADLATSPLSRRMFDEVWRPLEAAGPARAARFITTLAAYLDAQSSPTAAAKTLHLHPNAVTYRVRQATEILQRDLADPNERLIVHLACRAWLTYRRASDTPWADR